MFKDRLILPYINRLYLISARSDHHDDGQWTMFLQADNKTGKEMI